MTKEIEDIIKNKAFNELTADERKRVGDLAQNEEEYAHMQWFLVSASASFQANKINASPKVKSRVMEHLASASEKKGFWLNSVGVFMLPQGQPLYKKPAFQLGIAAALVVGFLFYFNQTLPSNQMAVNDVETIQNEETERFDSLSQMEEANKDAREVATSETQTRAETLRLNDQTVLSPVMVEEMDVIEDHEALVEQEMQDLHYFDAKVVNLEEPGRDKSLKEAEQAQEKLEIVDAADDVVGTSGYRSNLNKKRADSFAAVDAEVVKDSDENKNERLHVSPAVNAGSAPGEAAISTEEITPKSLHIDKTKELNQLFFIVK